MAPFYSGHMGGFRHDLGLCCQPHPDAVRDGRNLMDRVPASRSRPLASDARVMPFTVSGAMFGAPAHPNYREQFQRMGDAPV